ncbi:MAG: hypothetical protein JNK72_23665 [Myxococcales bacterium]|nr:hypothetical protein [Myxococcales bacterium]
MRPERLPFPIKIESELWLDEAIWGHRLYNEQTPWMTLLEMLGIAATQAGPRRFEEPEGYPGVDYQPVRRMALRSILFNAPFLDDTLRRHTDDDARWDAWLSSMKKATDELPGEFDFTYLRTLFPKRPGGGDGSFVDFVEVVKLLRTTAIEGDSNKRWTSKFVFPYGPACLFPDLRLVKKGELNADRRFFARNGELVYLMLCRSGRGPALDEALRTVALNPTASWNRLVERLQPPAEQSPSVGPVQHTGYLPYPTLPDYGAFADDLLVLMRLGLPGYDVLPHLVDMIGLHLVLYLLRRAAEWTPNEGHVRLVMEIVAPKKTTVRDLAVECFTANTQRTSKAVDAYISDVVVRSPMWERALAQEDSTERWEMMRAALSDAIRLDAEKHGLPTAPDACLDEVRAKAKRRHGEHLGEAHTAYAQAIGLASRRGTRRMRYAPSDQLLKTLVFTVVGERMEFQHFLAALFERYGMVIGPRQAEYLIRDGSADRAAFDDNAYRLEMRLASLGLLRRLSDACAYVENPMKAPK